MSLLTTIRAYQKALRKKALADLYPEVLERVHVYSSLADRVTQASDNYVGNARTFKTYVWVRKAVALIAQTIAPLPIRVVDASGKAVASHPLTALYANPNDTMPGPEFRAISLVHLMLGGERVSEIVDDSVGRPRELWPRRPDRVDIRPDDSRRGYPRAAEYVLADLATATYDGTVPMEAVIFERFVNPLSDWRGLSPISAVREGVQIALLAQAQRKLFYKNNARVEYALTAAEALTPDERERLEAQVAEKYGGGAGTGKPMILEYGQDIKSISYPPKDMTSIEDQNLSADEVAAIFGVPDILMGFGNDSYDTAEKRDAALSVLWALTLLPLVQQHDMTETHFWTSVRPLLRSGERVSTDVSAVDILQEDLGPKLENAGKLFAYGVPFNLIDSRLRLGLGPIPGGDVGYLPMNLIPVDQLSAPTAAPQRSITRDRRPTAARIGSSLTRIRLSVARRLEAAVDRYFQELADKVVARAREAAKAVTNGHGAAVKTLPGLADLLSAADDGPLYNVFRTYATEVVSASWETYNLALGLDIAFEPSDGAVVAALAQSGDRVSNITETTRQFLARLLQESAEAGLTIEEIVPGIRLLIEESYKGRSRTIARSETAMAQAAATVGRYDAVGVTRVVIFDGGGEDSDDACNQLNGTVQTLRWYQQHPIGHPNCTRSAGPYFD